MGISGSYYVEGTEKKLFLHDIQSNDTTVTVQRALERKDNGCKWTFNDSFGWIIKTSTVVI